MINDRGYFMDKYETDIHLCDVPLCNAIIPLFRIDTAVDIGCGNGSYTRKFIEAGIDCIGFDGCPLTPQISGGLCRIMDFSETVDIDEFDLVLCLEVGEHIPKAFEQVFIDNVCRAAKRYIVLSWATEGQGGHGHVNCQNNDYVIAELDKRGFVFDMEKSLYLREESTIEWFKHTVMVFKNGR